MKDGQVEMDQVNSTKEPVNEHPLVLLKTKRKKLLRQPREKETANTKRKRNMGEANRNKISPRTVGLKSRHLHETLRHVRVSALFLFLSHF